VPPWHSVPRRSGRNCSGRTQPHPRLHPGALPGHFTLPELSPVGSSCLANARDFQIPVAAYEHDTAKKSGKQWAVYNKFCVRLFVATQNHTPFSAVAWDDRSYSYKYDLGRFNTIGTIFRRPPGPVAQPRLVTALSNSNTRAPPSPTLSSSRPAGLSPRTLSARLPTTATSCQSAWASSTAHTLRKKDPRVATNRVAFSPRLLARTTS
jgi:hypothetical protein